MEIDLKKYIENSIPELNGRIYPLFTTNLSGVSLVYFFTPVSGGHLKQSELELRIIGQDYDACEAIRKQLDGCLDMEEDEPYKIYGHTRFHSELSGGGNQFNDEIQIYENTVIYTLKWRQINE